MEFGGWHLIHRDEKELLRLANAANIPGASIQIGQEPNGVNLFLHLKLASPVSDPTNMADQADR